MIGELIAARDCKSASIFRSCMIDENQDVHLSDGTRNFGPYAVNLLVQSLKREGLEGLIRLGEEANKAGGRSEGGHCDIGVQPWTDSCR